MGDTHKDPRVTFRAPEKLRKAAVDGMNGSGWTLQDVLHATLVAVRNDLGGLLAYLAPHRQPARPGGRPRKAAPPKD